MDDPLNPFPDLTVIAGVDEVGRGPLAGPVVAAAVILPDAGIAGLADSKKLTPRRRAALAVEIHATACVSIAEASVAEIDSLNIRRATHLAMCRAVSGLGQDPQAVLIDGHEVPDALDLPARAIIGGDGLHPAISAASIVAKVARDALMTRLDAAHPGYGWAQNAGYPTKAHRQALLDLGVSPHHRRTFRTVHNILCDKNRLRD